jgi:transposase
VSDATSLLYDLPGFAVVSVAEADNGLRRVVIMQIAVEHACPRCGVLVGGKPYDVRESRVKDLPMGHRALHVIWRKRRYRCAAAATGSSYAATSAADGGPRTKGRRCSTPEPCR